MAVCLLLPGVTALGGWRQVGDQGGVGLSSDLSRRCRFPVVGIMDILRIGPGMMDLDQ